MFAALISRVAIALAATLTALPGWAAVNGLWSSSRGDYLLFLRDATSGATFSIQVPAALDTIKVWTGSGSAASITLQGVLEPDDRLAASVSGSTMSGTITQGGAQSAFGASLVLGWVASANAGVWQKSAAANAYMVFCVLESGNGRLGLQIDVTLNVAEKTYRYDIFTGTIVDSTFNGASLTGSELVSRLEFGAGTLNGTVSTVARPIQSTSYTATQIVKIGD